MFKINNKDTRTKTLASFWCLYFSFEHISHLVPVFPLLSDDMVVSNNKETNKWVIGAPNRKECIEGGYQISQHETLGLTDSSRYVKHLNIFCL